MTSAMSTPVLLLLSTAVEGLAVALVVPRTVPVRSKITILLLFTLNVFLWLLYKIFIYPSFFSPLRHLPSPKVCVVK
jgi:hypothetical protein